MRIASVLAAVLVGCFAVSVSADDRKGSSRDDNPGRRDDNPGRGRFFAFTPPKFQLYNASGASVVSYRNTSLYVCAIKSLSEIKDYTDAKRVYYIGGFSANSRGGNRTMGGFARSNYSEPTYKLYSSFYNRELYFESWMGAALNGTGIYSNSEVQKASVQIFAQAYSFLYAMHEVDAAINAGFNTSTRPISVGRLSTLFGEIDGGFNVLNGVDTSECTAFKFISRLGNCLPDYLSPQVDIINGLNTMQRAAYALNTTAPNVQREYENSLAGRKSILTGIWRTYVAATVERVVSLEKYLGPRLDIMASALASFKVAAPLTAEINERATRRVLETLEYYVAYPNRQQRNKQVVKDVMDLIEDIFKRSHIDFKKTVYACKK